MTRCREYIPLPERLAAALACLLPQEQRDELRKAKVTAKAVIALFHMDHIILHAFDGADLWWNIDPKLVAPHREKSKRDTSIVAKAKRLDKEPHKWRNLTGLKPDTKPPERRRKAKIRSRTTWPKRPFSSRKGVRP